ncbi:MAG: Gfo/Idh/MocA family oxidoreductase, partial [Planctomycetota bacterium]
ADADAAGEANRLVAVCDPSEARRRGELDDGAGNLQTGAARFDPETVRGYADPPALFADPEVELVSLCTPTDTHVDLAIAALAGGKHVLVEKPVALGEADVERLREAAATASTLCMPAMCIRFWPAYRWLAERVADRRFGRLRGLSLARLGVRPGWGSGFYADPERCGGALFDLHVHDADFVHACLGPPRSIAATGNLDHVSALWDYGPDGPRVQLEGGWDHPDGFPFRMEYRAVFEAASVEFELGERPGLWVTRGDERRLESLPDEDGYRAEVRALLAAVRAGHARPPATVDEALDVTRLLHTTRSALSNPAFHPHSHPS